MTVKQDKLPSESPSEFSDRFLTRAVVAALLLLTGQWCWLSLQQPEPLPWTNGEFFSQLFRVEINSATWVEWMQLDGIGETMAHRIVADREANGPFRSIDEVQRVRGIGPATLDRIRPWLTMGHAISSEFPSDRPDKLAHQQSSAF